MEPPVACRNCGAPEVEPGYRLPLCATCRDALAHRPFPRWLWASLGPIALLMALSLAQFPVALPAGIAYERGERAAAAGEWATAAEEFQQVVAIYPDSTPALVKVVVAACKAKRRDLLAKYLPRLEGREVYSKQEAEVMAALTELLGPPPQEPAR